MSEPLRIPSPLAGSPEPRDSWILPVLRELVDASALDALVAERPESLWAAAVGRALAADDDVLRAASRHAGIPVADLRAVSPQALELIDARWARKHRVLPLSAGPRTIDVATADPHDADAERALAFASGRRVRFQLASPVGLADRIERAYRRGPLLLTRASMPVEVPELEHLSAESEAAPTTFIADEGAATITRILDRLLAEAIAGGASDLHIEPEEGGVSVRHRLDGVLRLVHTLPRAVAAALTSRVKIVSGLDIADRLRPQDGRARVAVAGRAVDLRISTLPTGLGEKVVIRILDARGGTRSLAEMGFAPDEDARLRRLLEAREGIILVTGPTGSGKTTTLYAALREIVARGVNVVTVEDPIEYRLPGIVQVQVRERSGLTFGAALRSIMRQDPDVILVGEIRDRETAEIAIQASLTGHLVLSTLHTNDAASAVTRLLDMGVEPHKLATALKGVVAQRLLRRRCEGCGGPTETAADGEVTVSSCTRCRGTGYRGRLAIVEILLSDGEVERLIAQRSPAEPIAVAARREGMRSLWESGLARVHAGETTTAELVRVAEPPWDAVAGAFGRTGRTPATQRADAGDGIVAAREGGRLRRARATFLALRLRRAPARLAGREPDRGADPPSAPPSPG